MKMFGPMTTIRTQILRQSENEIQIETRLHYSSVVAECVIDPGLKPNALNQTH